jgi:PD-(D/E)XK nuclease superfamily
MGEPLHFVVEHKTSGESIVPGSAYWRRLTIDPQIDMYVEGCESLGKKVHGVLYDVLGKPALKPLKATPIEKREYRKDGKLYARCRERDETPDEFERRCLDKIKEDPNRFYVRGTIVRLESERAESKADVWQTCTAIRDAKRLKVFPRNPDSCMQWNRVCDYFEVCTNTQSIDDPVKFKVHEHEHTELGPQGNGLLTQSAIRCFRSCQRRFFYRYVMRARPLKEPDEPLRMGTSIHRALEVWWKTGGDLRAALDVLDRKDPYLLAKERAMMMGYHARWDRPPPTEHVEAFFKMPLVNPETGASSRTHELAGKIDVIVQLDEELRMPTGDSQNLEAELVASLNIDQETGEVLDG